MNETGGKLLNPPAKHNSRELRSVVRAHRQSRAADTGDGSGHPSTAVRQPAATLLGLEQPLRQAMIGVATQILAPVGQVCVPAAAGGTAGTLRQWQRRRLVRKEDLVVALTHSLTGLAAVILQADGMVGTLHPFRGLRMFAAHQPAKKFEHRFPRTMFYNWTLFQ